MKLFMTGIRHYSCSLPPNLDLHCKKYLALRSLGVIFTLTTQISPALHTLNFVFLKFLPLALASVKIFTRGSCLGCLIGIYGPADLKFETLRLNGCLGYLLDNAHLS